MSSSYKIQAVLLVAVGAVIISFSRFVTLTSTFTGHFGVDSEEIDRRMRLEAKIRHTKYNISLPKLTVTDPASEMNEIPAPKFHLVISTGCSPFQDWQTFALFYHARKQIEATEDLGLSYATRVVSGCSEEDETRMNQIHEETIAPMAPGRFFIHHTPSYRYVKPGVDYVFFNKAFGYHHWMINSLRYPYNHQQYDDVTYILLDPDMLMMRPFTTNDFTNEKEMWGGPFQNKRKIEIGQPFAQEYGIGTRWLSKVDMEKIAPKDELPSPVKKVTAGGARAYQVGPPYIMKGFDLWRLVNKWVDFNPYVYDQLPDHITEMFAYSIAAAHLSLPHAVAQSFMVSHTEVETGEGWGLMDDSLDEQDCLNVQEEDLPHTFHFCQHYGLGKYFFSKYKLPADFISCGAPLLKEPPRNVATLYNYLHKPSGVVVNFKSKKVIRRSAFAICHIVKLLNEAAEHFKKHHCSAGEANYNKTLVFHENMDDT